MIKENDEEFFKNICQKYIDTMSKEMLLEADNKKILYIFIEDEYIELKEKGSINIQNYKDYLDGDFTVYQYNSYQELYKATIEDEILNDIEDLGLFDDNNQWNFYITFEELKRLEYGYKVQYNYPLLEKYIIENEEDFYTYFSLEQLNEFEESLHLYYETDDIDTNKWGELYSKSNKYFNNNIIALSEGMISYYDLLQDYKINYQQYYGLSLDKVIEYFRENAIVNLMDYGSDRDEGLYQLSSMYKEIMDNLGIKYSNVYTEDVSDGKYLTTITFEDDYSIEVDTSAWNGIEVVTENIKSIYEKYEKQSEKTKQNEVKNEKEFEYDFN